MRRRFALALTGILAVLGMAFTAVPASAAPAQSDDVGIQAIVGSSFTDLAGMQGEAPIDNNATCTVISPAANSGRLNELGVVMGVTVVFFSNSTCTDSPTSIVGVVNTAVTTPFSAPASSYTST